MSTLFLTIAVKIVPVRLSPTKSTMIFVHSIMLIAVLPVKENLKAGKKEAPRKGPPRR